MGDLSLVDSSNNNSVSKSLQSSSDKNVDSTSLGVTPKVTRFTPPASPNIDHPEHRILNDGNGSEKFDDMASSKDPRTKRKEIVRVQEYSITSTGSPPGPDKMKDGHATIY